ncbi:UDP diphosphate synthase [Halobacteriales archaeon QS_1_68_20]|nr:MAG: UDP diphosphate synthase [Halobacteriales archaeon QS_1_68_20]
MGLYDKFLALQVRSADASTPDHVALAVTERDLLEQGSYETLERFLRWTDEYGATRVSIYVSVLDPAAVPTLKRQLSAVEAPRRLAVRGPEDTERADAPIQVSIGHGGKEEFAEAVRSLATAVDSGDLAPEEVEATTVEEELVFAAEPDLFIKTGAERLSDFMIWQSVYSELYFTDVNWRDFRKRDYLRAIREFQNRQRRFGR